MGTDYLEPIYPEKSESRVMENVFAGATKWLVGPAHCIACGNGDDIHVAPAPVGLEPDMECANCHEMLCVFDEADYLKELLGIL